MEVKEAVRAAKDYVTHVYREDETISNLNLEETEYDQRKEAWKITLGFSRPFNSPATRAAELLDRIGAGPQLRRSYKVLTINGDGQVVSMKDRDAADA